jgi:hypothetical protein
VRQGVAGDRLFNLFQRPRIIFCGSEAPEHLSDYLLIRRRGRGKLKSA